MMNMDCLIVGAGQAGLSLAAMLAAKNINVCILEREARIGDVWRRRPDNMLLFTSRGMTQLHGLPFPGIKEGYPDKNEVADYLERYASHHGLAIYTQTEVVEVKHDTNGYRVKTKDGKVFHAPCLVNATGANQLADIPALAEQLSTDIQQIAADQYREPKQIKAGSRVAIIGDGASGRQIAKDLAATTKVTLFCGSSRPLLPNRILGKDIFWWLSKSGLLFANYDSLVGKIMRRRNPIPCGDLKNHRLAALDIKIANRLVDIKDNKLCDLSGNQYEVDTVIWCLGYKDDTAWLTLPGAADANGFVCKNGHEEGGKTPYPGLFIVGRKWLSSRGSELMLGAYKDTCRVAKWVENYLKGHVYLIDFELQRGGK
ncbi:potassium uptake trka-like protein [Photorhabdus luminescens subsp. mexicana]|uniref:Potassium uptake trka-like protein n=2 Tax=Photorhabdus luminescens TaxID=29488 RepID=A0A4R4J219_PHOLU|nr:potassium uptake trka-like protein [Photorhabdus luminescens subsp. mexicana]